MSGILTGISKVFKPVFTGIAKIGRGPLGVGATLFTAGAATAAPALASGGMSALTNAFGGGGVLKNIFSGVAKVGGFVTNPVAGAGGLARTGFDLAKSGAGFLSAGTPSGLAATGSVVAPGAGAAVAATAPGGGFLKGFGDFLQTETGAGILQGFGDGMARWGEQQHEAAMIDKQNDFLRGQEDRVRSSYDVAPDSYIQPPPPKQASRPRRQYDPVSKRIVMA